MKNIFYSIIAVILLVGCDEPYELDASQIKPILVIEGAFTNRADQNYVKLSLIAPFSSVTPPESVTDAIITVDGSDGSSLNFTHYSGTNADSASFYLPDLPSEAQAGVTYTLTILHSGKQYKASDSLLEAVPIDSLTSQINPFEFNDPWQEGEYYEILLYFGEPQDSDDFYRFKFFKNGKIENPFGSTIYITDDSFFGPQVDGIPIPEYYAESDTAIVEMLHISRNAYLYYYDLRAVLGNDGGMFSPPPANPRTNVDNGAVGFFLVANIESDTIIVK